MKPMPDERLFNSTVALDNRIFVLGGADHPYESCIDTVCCYDTTCDDWTLCPPMTREKANLAGVSSCGKIYAFGGGDGSESFLDVEVFDPAYGKWTKNQPMLKKKKTVVTSSVARPGRSNAGASQAWGGQAARFFTRFIRSGQRGAGSGKGSGGSWRSRSGRVHGRRRAPQASDDVSWRETEELEEEKRKEKERRRWEMAQKGQRWTQ